VGGALGSASDAMPRRTSRRATRGKEDQDNGVEKDAMDVEETPRSSGKSKRRGGGVSSGSGAGGDDQLEMCPLDLRNLAETDGEADGALYDNYARLHEKGADKADGLEGWVISDLNDMVTELTLMKEATLEKALYMKAQHHKLAEWETKLAISQGVDWARILKKFELRAVLPSLLCVCFYMRGWRGVVVGWCLECKREVFSRSSRLLVVGHRVSVGVVAVTPAVVSGVWEQFS